MSGRIIALLIMQMPLITSALRASDHFLTIGGGPSPRNNQASLESNVALFRRTLDDCGLAGAPHEVFFSCGATPMRDVQYLDPAADPPPANLLLSRLFN